MEALLPIPLHADGVVELLGYGWHVNLQKPMCNDLADARRMLEAAAADERQLRVMENYVFYEPLRKLKEIVESGELGEVSGYHMKMVGSGRGGWDVPASSYDWQFQQVQRGRGVLVFDDGWHKLATAIWLFGPIAEVRAWIGNTEVIDGIGVDAPTTLVCEHRNGIRGVLDITLAVDMYLRSDYYTNDERWEVTGRPGLRAGQPLHRPRHPAAEPRGLRRRGDALVPRPRRRLGQQLPRFGPPLAALVAHGRGPDALERRGGRRRVAVRARRLRQQRGGRHRGRPGHARLDRSSPGARGAVIPQVGGAGAARGSGHYAFPVARQQPAASLGRRMGALALGTVLVVGTLVVGWLGWSVFEWRQGRTPTYRLLGLRVVSRSGGQPIGLGRSFLRSGICCPLLVVPTAAAGAVVLLCFAFGASPPDGLFRQARRAPWDVLTATTVLDERPRPIVQLGAEFQPIDPVDLGGVAGAVERAHPELN